MVRIQRNKATQREEMGSGTNDHTGNTWRKIHSRHTCSKLTKTTQVNKEPVEPL